MKRLIIIILLGLLAAWGGCKDEPAASAGEIEVWTGDLHVTRILEAYPVTDEFTDEVILTIEGALYNLDHVVNNSNLCDTRGRISSFGFPTFTLTPTGFNRIPPTCDTIRIVRGEFSAVFRNDSLFAIDTVEYNTQTNGTPRTDTLIFDFALVIQ